MTRFFLPLTAVLFFYQQGFAQGPQAAGKDAISAFQPVKWRCIGPFRGGRSVCATGVTGNPMLYYMGTTGGGLWKTEDMGLSWSNISDGYFKTGSVGAVAVAESDPNVILVGMGEHAVRGVMTHHGDGVYASTDAGKTWKHAGLEKSQHIARIIIHPKNPDIVYVAAQGALYGPSSQRGVFKSTDGGRTWKNTLFVNDSTGCSELSMDAANPRILYAAMWEYGRKPWQVKSGGPGSNLYKSTDGGETWVKLEEGLPADKGKMAIAVCRSNPDKVYALLESDFGKEAGGLYVSNNGGQSWSQVSSDHRLIQRAWYYIELFTDPQNDQTLYVLSAPALKSTDGGKTWEDFSGTHGDYHNLWINPANPANMIISDDGGSAITLNGGKSWSPQNNQPTAQLYRLNADRVFPYRIYAGQQDNTSISIPHRVPGRWGIDADQLVSSAGGESAFLAFDPNDPRYVMGGSYQGTIEIMDMQARAGTNIMAAPLQYLGMDAKDMRYRYNWNAPIIRSQHEPGVYYHAAQLLLRTDDRGRSWKHFSPDLTRNEYVKQGKGGVPYTNEAVGAENYGTIAYVKESPHEKGVFYTGSDDGLVFITRDNGASWQNITPKGLPECLVNAIEVSPHDKATVYIATTRYKFNDHTPALYKSTDYGKTWTNISKGIPETAFTRVVREDAVRRDLLFAGTETGLFLSWNGGKSWQSFQLNLPLTPVTDLMVHEGNLIAATSGRSIWILDDLALLRQYDSSAKGTVLYTPAPSFLINGYSELDESNPDFTGLHRFRGINAPTGMVIYYTLPALKDSEEVKLEIRDMQGVLIRSFSSRPDSTYKKYDGGPPSEPVLPRTAGLNRFVWNMRHATIPGVPDVYIEANYRGHKAVPGEYRINLQAGNTNVSSKGLILRNPLYHTTAADYQAFDTLMRGMEKRVTVMHQMVNRLYGYRKQLEKLRGELPAGEKYRKAGSAADSLLKALKAWDDSMVQRKTTAYDDVENFPNRFTAEYMFLLNQADSDLPRVNQPVLEQLAGMNQRWEKFSSEGRSFLEQQLPALNRLFWEAGVGALWVP